MKKWSWHIFKSIYARWVSNFDSRTKVYHRFIWRATLSIMSIIGSDEPSNTRIDRHTSDHLFCLHFLLLESFWQPILTIFHVHRNMIHMFVTGNYYSEHRFSNNRNWRSCFVKFTAIKQIYTYKSLLPKNRAAFVSLLALFCLPL